MFSSICWRLTGLRKEIFIAYSGGWLYTRSLTQTCSLCPRIIDRPKLTHDLLWLSSQTMNKYIKLTRLVCRLYTLLCAKLYGSIICFRRFINKKKLTHLPHDCLFDYVYLERGFVSCCATSLSVQNTKVVHS